MTTLRTRLIRLIRTFTNEKYDMIIYSFQKFKIFESIIEIKKDVNSFFIKFLFKPVTIAM
jgi:hypothetical protein